LGAVCRSMLRDIPLYFQWLPLTTGDSMQHTRDMEGRKKTNPIDIKLALAFVAGSQILAEYLKQEGIRADDPVVQRAVVDDLKRQYDQKQRDEAWSRRSDWRKADVESLVSMFLLPGNADPAVQREIAQLMLAPDKTGAPVLRAKSFDESLQDGIDWVQRPTNPATSKVERRESPWYPRLIENAYRGELAAEKKSRRKSNEDYPRRPASEIAEEKVAEAAGITLSIVHALCQQVRDEHKKAKVWAAAQPGRWVHLEPPITANELKRHLAQLP
jgi:hypothetical protein